jgi:hypothetical protein
MFVCVAEEGPNMSTRNLLWAVPYLFPTRCPCIPGLKLIFIRSCLEFEKRRNLVQLQIVDKIEHTLSNLLSVPDATSDSAIHVPQAQA